MRGGDNGYHGGYHLCGSRGRCRNMHRSGRNSASLKQGGGVRRGHSASVGDDWSADDGHNNKVHGAGGSSHGSMRGAGGLSSGDSRCHQRSIHCPTGLMVQQVCV
jgi:hypothetical protein